MNKSSLLLATLSLALLAACGQKDAGVPAAPTTSSAAPAPAAAPAAENTVGKSVYGKTCALCHAAGVAGAPKPGDKADWGPRIAQGLEVMNKHALEGYTGAKGQMPARGGAATLSDDEVKAAVAFMADQSR
jgi:cytochrome c5